MQILNKASLPGGQGNLGDLDKSPMKQVGDLWVSPHAAMDKFYPADSLGLSMSLVLTSLKGGIFCKLIQPFS